MATLEARGLHKRFGDHVVLEDISLTFPDRQLSGIMGPNGAGKTTCFNVLTGRFAPDRGTVTLGGEDITGLPPRLVARKGVSRSFQIMNVFNESTALENVLLAVPEVRGSAFNPWRNLHGDSAAMDKAARVLADVGLSGREHTQAKSLSYGDRRALEIGIALAAEPRVLFLDEPTSGLGADGKARLRDLVLSIKGRLTLVMIEHDMQFLFGMADSIAVIHWGQVIRRGTPVELRENPWVQASNLGKLA